MIYKISLHDVFLYDTEKCCPICETELRVETDLYKEYYPNKNRDNLLYEINLCPNHCYNISKFKDIFQFRVGWVRIYDETFTIHRYHNKAQRRKIIRDINAKLRYWKENERYLMNLLERKI